MPATTITERGSTVHPSESTEHPPAIPIGRSLATALILTFGVSLWLVRLQVGIGVHERHALPFLLHWLRDATLAGPAVVAAVLVARERGNRLLEGSGAKNARLTFAVEAGAGALGASVAFALAS